MWAFLLVFGLLGLGLFTRRWTYGPELLWWIAHEVSWMLWMKLRVILLLFIFACIVMLDFGVLVKGYVLFQGQSKVFFYAYILPCITLWKWFCCLFQKGMVSILEDWNKLSKFLDVWHQCPWQTWGEDWSCHLRPTED